MFLAYQLLIVLVGLCYGVSAWVTGASRLGDGQAFVTGGTSGLQTSKPADAAASTAASNGPLLMLLPSAPSCTSPSNSFAASFHRNTAIQHSIESGNSWKRCRQSATQLGAAVLPDNYPLTSVETMRRVYGPRRRWWGDLNAQQTRAFYHELLPVSLALEMGGDASSSSCEAPELSLEERARRASMARHAARIYARERCALPSRVTAALYDGFRHLQAYGTWSWTGQSWDEIWAKYEGQIRAAHPDADDSYVREAVCRRILEKSCCTNQMFDALAGMAAGEAARKKAEKEEALRAMNVLVRRRVTQAKRRIAAVQRKPLVRAPLLESVARPLFRRSADATLRGA